MIFRRQLEFPARGRGSYEISETVGELVAASEISEGLCNVFLQHTSASLILCENADPDVRVDLESFFSRIAPENDPVYRHTAEGSDDMPAHIRSVLTQNSITLPITGGRLALGTWQGLYLFEHRRAAHRRRALVTVWG